MIGRGGAAPRRKRVAGGRPWDRRLLRARRHGRARPSAWRDRSTGRCDTFSPSRRKARRWSSRTASTRSAPFSRARASPASSIPSYTRMVPAHHVVEIRLVGCPDPDATHTRFFTPARNAFSAGSRRHRPALRRRSRRARSRNGCAALPAGEPDRRLLLGRSRQRRRVSRDISLLLRRWVLNPGRLKAFTLSSGRRRRTSAQARASCRALDLELFLEPIEMPSDAVDPFEAVRVMEDYKPLDVESAAMALALCRGVRRAVSRTGATWPTATAATRT